MKMLLQADIIDMKDRRRLLKGEHMELLPVIKSDLRELPESAKLCLLWRS